MMIQIFSLQIKSISSNVIFLLNLSAKGGLYISNLESGDAGTYRLYAENSFLKSKSTQFARQLVKEIALGVYGEFFFISLLNEMKQK